MTVDEFMSPFTDADDQLIQIDNIGEQRPGHSQTVFKGRYGDIPENLDYAELCSVDNIYADIVKKHPDNPPLVLNVDLPNE